MHVLELLVVRLEKQFAELSEDHIVVQESADDSSLLVRLDVQLCFWRCFVVEVGEACSSRERSLSFLGSRPGCCSEERFLLGLFHDDQLFYFSSPFASSNSLCCSHSRLVHEVLGHLGAIVSDLHYTLLEDFLELV